MADYPSPMAYGAFFFFLYHGGFLYHCAATTYAGNSPTRTAGFTAITST